MSIAILFVLLLLALVMKKRRRHVLLLFTLALFLAVGSGFVPALLIQNLQTDATLETPQWGKKNAIIVLGGGTYKEGEQVRTSPLAIAREFEALRLYHSCKTAAERECHLVLSGGDPLKNGVAEADVMARELQQSGVPESDLVIENKSHNTFQNAQFSSPLIHSGNYDGLVLVTSGMHLRRSRLYFDHFQVHAQAAPADHLKAIVTPLPVSFNFMLTDFSLHELVGIARLYVYDWLGLNTPSESHR